MSMEEINKRFQAQAGVYIKPLRRWKRKCRRRGILILCLAMANTAFVLGGSGYYIHLKNAPYLSSYSQTMKTGQLLPFPAVRPDTQETQPDTQDTQPEDSAEITFHKNVVIHNEAAELGLQIPASLSGTWKICIYIKETLLYESDFLYPGTLIPKVLVDSGDLQDGSYEGSIEIRQITGQNKSQAYQRKVTVDLNNGSGSYIVEGGRG